MIGAGTPCKANLLNERPQGLLFCSYNGCRPTSPFDPPARPPAHTSTPGVSASSVGDHPPGGRWPGGFIRRYPLPVWGSQEVQPDSEGQLGCLTWREKTLGTLTRKQNSQHKQTHKLNGVLCCPHHQSPVLFRDTAVNTLGS